MVVFYVSIHDDEQQLLGWARFNCSEVLLIRLKHPPKSLYRHQAPSWVVRNPS